MTLLRLTVLASLLTMTLAWLTPMCAQQGPRLTVAHDQAGDIVVILQDTFHAQYGFLYPATFRVTVPGGTSVASVQRKYHSIEAWTPLGRKTSAEYFNGIEAFRYDSTAATVYISAAFSSEVDGDSLFLNVRDASGLSVRSTLMEVCDYYDNRRAAVTVSADDWSDWTKDWFAALFTIFRSYDLRVTAGIITQSTSRATWGDIQLQLLKGNIEAASHSRTHPYIPYADPIGEVSGSTNDILALTLPSLSRSSTKQYLYTWLAPYGEYDAIVDSLLTTRSYIVARLYPDDGTSTFSAWNERAGHFAPVFPTHELGAPSWGGGMTDTTTLAAEFDKVVAAGGIYHIMWHPQVIIPDTGLEYFKHHLGRISRRNDLWYITLGHLFLNHLLHITPISAPSAVAASIPLPATMNLEQSYPNPANPGATIRYSLSRPGFVRLAVYDLLGREVSVLVNSRQESGNREVRFDGAGLASGVYFYRLQSGNDVETRKLTLLK